MKSFTIKDINGSSITYPLWLRSGEADPQRSERMVELSLAYSFCKASSASSIIPVELGAVTPYHFPSNTFVIDPIDTHAHVKAAFGDGRINLLAYPSILSISTLEHIGTNDYGMTPSSSLRKEVMQLINDTIFDESKEYGARHRGDARALFTVPWGYNIKLDQYILQSVRIDPGGFDVYLLARQATTSWNQVNLKDVIFGREVPPAYDFSNFRANAVWVLSHGNLPSPSPLPFDLP